MEPIAEHLLSIDNVSKHYGAVVALDRVSLQVPKGEFITFLGPSGSGKTTLLMCIAGFIDLTHGEISFDDRVINYLPPERRNFGMVFQGFALFPHMTVAENVAFPLDVRHTDKTETRRRVGEMLDLVQLSHLDDRKPKQLSGGQQQRVALARALVFAPDILLLDEPLSALDKKLRRNLQYELKELHQRVGCTFIYVTHDQEEALSMSDRVAIIDDGRVVQSGSPTELYDWPSSAFVADFLGKSNFFTGQVEAQDGGNLSYRVKSRLFVQARDSADFRAGDQVTIAVRPEKIEISEDKPGEQVNITEGVVSGWNFYGASFDIKVRTEEFGEINVVTPAWRCRINPAEGKPVWIHWAPEASVVLEDR